MTEQLIAREYRRLSDKKGGTSLDDQGYDNAAAAEENDWALGDPYIDDGLSASRYARKRRDEFELLVADLESGPTGRASRFGADILMLWESSRGSRRVGEWVSFIELCEVKGVRIWVTTHERLYDPANGRDRKALIDDAVDSEYESYKTHKRVSRTAPREAERGRPHGKAPYGLMPVYDRATGKLITWVADPVRVHVPCELFERLERGESFAAIERIFFEAGYRNLSGRPFTHGHLRMMATRHSYAGLRFYKGTVYEGCWDGIVPRERFWNVYRMVTDPKRCTTKAGLGVHDVTAAFWCGECEVLLGPRFAEGRKPAYRCADCGRKIAKDPIDELIIGKAPEGARPELGVLLAYLARPDVYDLLRAPEGDGEELRGVVADLAQARAERDELARATGGTLAEVRVLANSLQAKEDQVSELEVRERQLSVPAQVLSIVEPGKDIWESWHAAPMGARRTTARLVLSPRYLGRPCLLPSPLPGRWSPIAERIEWRRTEAPSRATRV